MRSDRAALLTLVLALVLGACATPDDGQKGKERAPEDVLFPAAFADAQQIAGASQSQAAPAAGTRTPAGAPEAEEEESRGDWLIAPIPFLNPTIEGGLILIGGYVFRLDPRDRTSPPSTIGAGGLYSTNESKGAVVGFKGYLDEDRWRILAGLGTFDLNYRFYGIGAGSGDESVELNQKINAGVLEVLRGVGDGVFLGGRLAVIGQETSLRDVDDPADLLPDETSSTITTLGIRLQWDTRDDTFYPRRGGILDFALDGLYENQPLSAITQTSYSHYFSVDGKTVLAVRGRFRYAGEGTPFYALSTAGPPELRGYAWGQYLDRMLLAGVAELRRELIGNLGAVAFAGVGWVASDLEEMRGSDTLPSLGIGLRYTVTKKNHINLRLDYAWGKDGAEALYIGVTEFF
jgi:hypothetical protein